MFLLFTAIILFAGFLVINLVNRFGAGRSELLLSQRCEELLGKEITEKLILEFQEQNPDIRIRLVDEVPDLLFFDESGFSRFVHGKAVVSHENSENTEAAAPLAWFIDVLFYNTELLRTAGFNRPPKTRAEFLTYGKAVSGEAAGAALGMSPNDRHALPRDIYSWIWSAGGSFWPGTEGSHNPAERPVLPVRTTTEVISFLGELSREGILASQTFTTTGEERLEQFARGQIAMMVGSSRDIPMMRDKMGDDVFGVTAIPDSGLPVKIGAGLSGIYAGISSTCKKPNTAWSFLVFLGKHIPAIAVEIMAIPGAIPGLSPEYSSFGYINGDPYYSKIREIFESSEIVRGFSREAQAEELERIVWEELHFHFENNRNAVETTSIIQQRLDTVYNDIEEN